LAFITLCIVYFISFSSALLRFLLDSLRAHYSHFSQLVCYGIGPFTRDRKASAQYLLLKALANALQPSEGTVLFDPVFSDAERAALAADGFTLLDINEHARRSISSHHGAVLFFMPHCGWQLFQNLLDSNWSVDNLSRLAIIGNSFALYNTLPHRRTARRNCITACSAFVREFALPIDSCLPYDALNDCSLHTFDPARSAQQPPTFWQACQVFLEPASEVC
jgi:hypothetical protein